VTPGPIVPARELYGAMLLERGKAKDALAAFEATLKKEPHRLGATLGAAKAASRPATPAGAAILCRRRRARRGRRSGPSRDHRGARLRDEGELTGLMS
jgi:hypothetical protein